MSENAGTEAQDKPRPDQEIVVVDLENVEESIWNNIRDQDDDISGDVEWAYDYVDESDEEEDCRKRPLETNSQEPRKRLSTEMQGQKEQEDDPRLVLTFDFVDPAEPEGAYGSKDDPINTMSLSPSILANHIALLQGADDVVIPKAVVTLKVSYPFEQDYVLELRPPAPDTHFTRAGLLKSLASKYYFMYSQDSAKRRLWGPRLDDLMLEHVKYNPEDNTCVPSIYV